MVIGESSAWREIVDALRQCGLAVRRPGDIVPLLAQLRATFQPSVDKKKSEIAQDVANSEKRIASLRAEKGVWPSFLNWFRIQECKKAIARLHSNERKYIATLSDNIQRLVELRDSRELVGAKAELDVIAHLAHLPTDYTVFNDIRLMADRHIRFNGIPLQSAQIDHIVLSSAGVFVIETKRWGRHFVESGNYHDPYDQIQRAVYLCYDQLQNRFGKVRVRSVIACAGMLPLAPHDSHVKILRMEELNGYITWFREPELPPELIMQVRNYLEELAMNENRAR